MTSLTATSRRSSSSTSVRTSARYSTSSSSSSCRCQGSPGVDSMDPLLEPSLLDHADPCLLFKEEDPVGPQYLAHFGRPSRTSLGHTGGTAPGWQTSTGAGHLLVDHYYTSADVSRFQPHDIVVMAFNNHVVIHAEKVMEDGSICDTFTHKSSLPEDMDPLSLKGTLRPDGVLVVSVQCRPCVGGGGGRLTEPPGAPAYTNPSHR